MGRRLFTHAPHYKLSTTTHDLVTTVASGFVSDGPSRTFRTAHDLIRKATIVIFGDDLDSGAATAHVADRKRSAIRCDDRIHELVRSPVILIGRRKIDVSNFATRVIHDRDRRCSRHMGCGQQRSTDHDANTHNQSDERREKNARFAQRSSHVSYLSSKQLPGPPVAYGQRLFTVYPAAAPLSTAVPLLLTGT